MEPKPKSNGKNSLQMVNIVGYFVPLGRESLDPLSAGVEDKSGNHERVLPLFSSADLLAEFMISTGDPLYFILPIQCNDDCIAVIGYAKEEKLIVVIDPRKEDGAIVTNLVMGNPEAN